MSDFAKQYCYDRVAKPGSPLSYSLRYLAAAERDKVVAVHAFYAELEEIIFICQEPSVALVKLNWWANELIKEKSDHPVILFLQKFNFPPEKLLSVIDGVQEKLILTPFSNFEEVMVHLMRTVGERELLINPDISPESIYQAVLVVEWVNYLQQLRRYVQRNMIYFPVDEMMKFSVTRDMLRELKTTLEIKNLFNYQAEKIERAYAAVQADGEKFAKMPLFIRCKMAYATLKELQASDFSVLENWVALTPLRLWWIAWRR